MSFDKLHHTGGAAAAFPAAFVFACSAGLALAAAGRKEAAPEELEDVGVTEHLDVQVPGDIPFIDSGGKRVTLGRYFDGKRPVLLTLNYSNCPMLCTLQLNGLFRGLGAMKWNIGEQFQMVTVSIDPKETPGRARLTKEKYLKMYGRPGSAAGYHVLTGRAPDIRKLADAVGFRYKFIPETGKFAHVAVTIILTPEGRISRYLYGVEYNPQTLRLSLLEAGEGKIGTTTDQILLYCFHYDASKGRYGPAAFNLMRAGGLATVLIIGAAMLVFWRWERRKAHRREAHVGA